jgi:NAD(P)-dependent dehydrogenase (short-subunit alcohol dehydrogenase family)
MSLKGKYALITGSSRGIGRGIALQLAGLGVKVAINYCRNEVAANDALSKIRGLGSDGFIVQGDVCRPDDIVRMFSRAKQEFGALDIFVANARPEVSEFYQPPMEITLESWQTAIDSQARAFLVGAREASAVFRDGGRIIAITYVPGGRFGSWQP